MEIAHTASARAPPHVLTDHLQSVAALAASFARAWNGAAWAELAGRWHDLGKFAPAFQNYLRKAGENAAHAADLAPMPRVDHSTAGAMHAVDTLKTRGMLLAYAIAGHHAGLPDHGGPEAGRAALSQRLDRRDLLTAALAVNPDPRILAACDLPRLAPGTDLSLFVRMIFSALVDADRLDTEHHCNPETNRARRHPPAIADLVSRLDARLAAVMKVAPATPVNAQRRALLEACCAAAARPPGLFSLTAPTGLGKTLSGLAFALRHATAHGLRRVIYVAPYTSIIDQTAQVFRHALGEEAVLEHHSNLDPANEAQATTAHRLAAENWDAAVVVTTAVQFFESLFAAHPGRCRKLHRVAGAVVFLDEAQLLPPDFLRPILRTLHELMQHYGTTLVLATATQPALDPRTSFDGLTGPAPRHEIVPNPGALHAAMRRVRVRLPPDLDTPTDWPTLAARLAGHPSVLCIVDRRRDARNLHALMPPGSFHLSALMCAAHRAGTLQAIRRGLAAGEPVRVVSTQLVEAGVDLDFPVLYRALAGLDSLAQAAGRCNREGSLAEGEVHVFIPPEPAPRGHLRQASDITRLLLRDRPEDPFTADLFRRYFEQLYWVKGDRLDREGICRLLPPQPQDLAFHFRTAAERFRLIPDDDASVLVPYGADGTALIEDFRRLRNTDAPRRDLFRRSQRLRVGVARREINRLEADGMVEQIDVDLWAAAPWAYHAEFGLDIASRLPPEAMVL